MKILFDTNLLVAAAFPSHVWYSRAVAQLERVFESGTTGYLSAHSLAEFYSVSTRYPVTPMPPHLAEAFLNDTLQEVQIVELSAIDYRNVIARVSKLGLRSGSIFDALIAQAALKTEVDQLITFNSKHFTRLGKDVEAIVFEP